MKILSHAKVNLTLHIERKRSDGFHDLSTWMIPIGLCDQLEIELASNPGFETNVAELKFDQSNLIYRAVERFHTVAGVSGTYHISLEKNIPMGAGLGGGSSNASMTLLALNYLHGEPLKTEELIGVAAQIGSDTAFFIRSEAAWCTGRGEKMESKPFPPGYWVTLFKPGFGVSTAAAYAAYGQMSGKKGEVSKTPWGDLRNDLEPPVFQKFLLLPTIKEWLKEQPETIYASMSGSGSTMFAVVDHQQAGIALCAKFLERFGDKFWTANAPLNELEPV